MPVSSIPSRYGIGTFSRQAYEFIDLLEKAGQSYWQILPLGPTGYGDSPYQSFSTFAGNPYYIDLETLIEEGCLTEEDCVKCDFGDNDRYIDYEKIYLSRFKVLKTAFRNSHPEQETAFRDFVEENSYWLDDYALYMAVKNSFDGRSWSEWDEDIKLRRPEAMKKYREEYAEEVEFYKFQQYLFAKQWLALKAYANQKKIQIIGDIPIYVAFDSADTWANPELFQLDDTLTPVAVAGCPPDAFSATGQLWGNPLYRWDYHRQTGYQWWISRLEYSFRLCDVLRIDHFRGFDEYYSIPYGEETAVNGHWEKGPGIDLFRHMERALGWKEVIAEDLGFVTDSVRRMVQESGFPGMKVLEFAFDTRDSGSANDYLPHNYIENCVVYTGTHDNETIAGWLDSIPKEDVQAVRDYLCDQHTPKKLLYKSLISMAMRSCAKLCIIPMQDYLGFDNTCRINTPSTVGENWKWRLKGGELTDQLQEEIHEICKRYGRLNWSNEKIAEPEEDEEEDIEGAEDVEATETA